jgi:hypothetical protein
MDNDTPMAPSALERRFFCEPSFKRFIKPPPSHIDATLPS